MPIVVAFDIGEQVAPRGIAIGVLAVVNELGFQSTKEALHRGIVPAVPTPRHGGCDVILLSKDILIRL